MDAMHPAPYHDRVTTASLPFEQIDDTYPQSPPIAPVQQQHNASTSHRTRHARPLSFRWGLAALLSPTARFTTPSTPHIKRTTRGGLESPASQLRPLLPLSEPAPAYIQSPTLYRETTPYLLSPSLSTDDERRAYNDDHDACANPRQHALANHLITHATHRHQRAWTRKRSDRSTMPSPSSINSLDSTETGWTRPPISDSARRRGLNRIRLARCMVFALALVGLLAGYLTLALRTSATPLPVAAHAILVLLLIALAILLLHSLIRWMMHVRSPTSSLLVSQHLRRERERERTRHRSRRHHRKRQHHRAMPQPTLLNLHNDPNALPDGDDVYTPTTPVRVHLVHEEAAGLGGDKPLEYGYRDDGDNVGGAGSGRGSVVELAAARTPLAPGTPSIASCRVAPLAVPAVPFGASESHHRDHEATTTTITEAAMTTPTPPPPPPPAYGLWRCSVRADPELLHWATHPHLHPHPASALVHPTSPAGHVSPSADAPGAATGIPGSHAGSLPPAYDTLSTARRDAGVEGGVGIGDRGSWAFNQHTNSAVIHGDDDYILDDEEAGQAGQGVGAGAGRRASVQSLTRLLLRN